MPGQWVSLFSRKCRCVRSSSGWFYHSIRTTIKASCNPQVLHSKWKNFSESQLKFAKYSSTVMKQEMHMKLHDSTRLCNRKKPQENEARQKSIECTINSSNPECHPSHIGAHLLGGRLISFALHYVSNSRLQHLSSVSGYRDCGIIFFTYINKRQAVDTESSYWLTSRANTQKYTNPQQLPRPKGDSYHINPEFLSSPPDYVVGTNKSEVKRCKSPVFSCP